MDNTNYETENSLNPEAGETFDSPAELERQEDALKEAAAIGETSNVEEPTPNVPGEETVEDLKAQRDRLYARLKKIEQKTVAKPIVPQGGEGEWKSKVEFLLENRDVTEDEYKHLASVALRQSGSVNADSLRDAKKDEADYIAYRRKQEELKRKVPGSTPSSPYAKITKSSEDISKMTPQEHRKYEAELLRMEANQGI